MLAMRSVPFFDARGRHTALTGLGSVGIGGLALAVMFPRAVPVPAEWIVGSWLVFLTVLAWRDQATRQVPNWAVYPLMAAGLVRAILGGDAAFVPYWIVIWIGWCARVYGGGDAKFLLGLFGMFPNERMVWAFVIGVLATGVPALVWKYRGRWLPSLRGAAWRLVSRQFLPAPAELAASGRPGLYHYCLAGAVYVLWFAQQSKLPL